MQGGFKKQLEPHQGHLQKLQESAIETLVYLCERQRKKKFCKFTTWTDTKKKGVFLALI
jgi:hypothetical protein